MAENKLNINKIVYSADDPKTILQLLNQCASAINGIIDYYTSVVESKRYFRHEVTIHNSHTNKDDKFYFNTNNETPITTKTDLFNRIVVEGITTYGNTDEPDVGLVLGKDAYVFVYYSTTNSDNEGIRFEYFAPECTDVVTTIV